MPEPATVIQKKAVVSKQDMSKPAKRIRGGSAKPKVTSAASLDEGLKDRFLAELELERTRSQLRIERLQHSQEEMADYQRRLQVYENGPVGYLTLNSKGVLLECNKTAARLLGCQPKELLGAPLTFLVPRADLEVILQHLARCRRPHSGPVVSELRLQHRQHSFPAQIISFSVATERGTVFQTTVVDLTERKKSEFALEEAVAFSDAIVGTIHEPLLVLDAGLKIVRMNEAFARVFNVPAQFTRGWTLESVMNVWWAGNEFRTRLQDALQKGVPLNNFELEVRPRHLGRRLFVFNARRLYQKEGSPPALLVAIEDVTARKEAEQKAEEAHRNLRLLNEQLEQRVAARTRELAESNKQLEAFCYSIAHDLRAPLRAMAGFSSTLQSQYGPKLGDKGGDFLERIIAAGSQMDALIHDLLEYGRFNTVEFSPAPVNADEVLSKVLGSLQPTIQEKNASIERAGTLPLIWGHKVVLEAAFSNLLSNALKFVPPETKPHVKVWAEARDKDVCISVADNGIGIEPQYQKKIFEVFQRLHGQNLYPGTGIGLAIVQRAVNRVGGSVGVDSEPGKGSRFWLTFPNVPPPADSANPQNTVAPLPPS